MKALSLLLFIFLIAAPPLFSQTVSSKYSALIKKADVAWRVKNYRNAGMIFSQAFKLEGKNALAYDRYNAACAWAHAEMKDSAFAQLQYIVAEKMYSKYEEIISDRDLNSLHKDKRWKTLIKDVQLNKERKEAMLNKPLIAQLKTIYLADQEHRKQLDSVNNTFGFQSKEIKDLWKTINETDSLNLIQIKKILDEQGWLGPDIVGTDGSTTIWLVIQHADQKTQEKYLPMMREAVKNGKADASELAYLEDRVALKQGKKQKYGTQVTGNRETGIQTVSPIEDEVNVDKRRAEVGLGPLADYLKPFGIEYIPKKKVAPPSKTVPADIKDALLVKDSIVGPVYVSRGYGKVRDFGFSNSELNEYNSAWFKIIIPYDTVITFDIVPENPKDDFDYIFFKCADTSCFTDLRTNKIKPDRSCFSVNFSKYGSTGLSEYEDAVFVGGGHGNGYVAAVPVKKDEVYYLMVNYPYPSKSKSFTIYFYNLWPNKPSAKDLKKKSQPGPKTETIENVLFETGTAKLLPASFVSLNKLVSRMKTNTMKIEIQGHTDDQGTEENNQILSEERAKAVMDYLLSKSIAQNRLSFKGFGSKKSVGANDTEEGRKKNRRVEFVILK